MVGSDLSSSLRSWAALLTAVAGLAAVFLKPENHDAAKAGYKELSSAIDKLSAQTSVNHDDLVALRGYVAAKEGELLIAPVATTVDAGTPPPRPAVTPRRVIHLSDVQVLGQVGAGAGAPAEAPPEPHSPPSPVHPADFDSVLKTLK